MANVWNVVLLQLQIIMYVWINYITTYSWWTAYIKYGFWTIL